MEHVTVNTSSMVIISQPINTGSSFLHQMSKIISVGKPSSHNNIRRSHHTNTVIIIIILLSSSESSEEHTHHWSNGQGHCHHAQYHQQKGVINTVIRNNNSHLMAWSYQKSVTTNGQCGDSHNTRHHQMLGKVSQSRGLANAIITTHQC